MPEFVDLQKNAMSLSDKLASAYAKHYSFGGLFCPCFPLTTNTRLVIDIELIQQTAYCLNFYEGRTGETRKLVLMGMYLYVWYQYNSPLQRFLNKTLLNLLQEQLEIDSLNSITYKNSLKELSNFSEWVFDNRKKKKELNQLYKDYPADMQGNLHTQRGALVVDEPPFKSTLSNLMTQIGLKDLF